MAGTTASAADADHPVVVLDTTAGPITLELDRTKAPVSVDNFMKYVDKGFYDGLVFHRVIPDFMIQTGGMTDTGATIREKREGAFPADQERVGQRPEQRPRVDRDGPDEQPELGNLAVLHQPRAHNSGSLDTLRRRLRGVRQGDRRDEGGRRDRQRRHDHQDRPNGNPHEDVPIKAIDIKTRQAEKLSRAQPAIGSVGGHRSAELDPRRDRDLR